ncbi:hypothetical protein M1813_003692 [Neofusicoccum parvum]|uniref:Uncharacterized protein n=1 Tax=Neofusicoccum parvum TaxID=310453 RepID=A0ACB5RYA7_9PEZI|nr:hypothetical protein M1813_003692 [Neofusicoccum parvum]
MADLNGTTTPSCAICGKTDGNIKRCAKCHTTHYCSRDCQKADWKTHKKSCAINVASASAASSTITNGTSTRTPPKNLSVQIDKPFTRLDSGTWLHDRPEKDVYKLLIDTFRLRLNDDYNLEAINTDGSVFAGERNSLPAFRKFLRKLESRQDLLPPWWNEQKKAECIAAGMVGAPDWSSLEAAPKKSDILEHYGDSQMPMQMRMLGERIYGRGPGGQDGTMMLSFMKLTEAGELSTETLDMSRMFNRS